MSEFRDRLTCALYVISSGRQCQIPARALTLAEHCETLDQALELAETLGGSAGAQLQRAVLASIEPEGSRSC